MLQLGALGLLGTFETVRMKDVGLSESQIGLILGLENGLMIFTALAWGKWADHTRRFRSGIIVGTLGLVVTLAWFAHADDWADFVIYGIMRGLFVTSIMGLMPALALANLDPAKPGAGFGGYRRFGSLGFLFAAAGLPLLFDQISSMAFAAMVYLPVSIWFVQRLADPAAPRAGGGDEVAATSFRRVGFFLAAHFFVSMAEPGVHGFFAAYARDMGASLEWVGMLSGMTGLMALLTLSWMGRLADRIGAARMLVIGFVAQGLRMLLTSFISDPQWLWLPHLLHGFGWAGREVGTLLFLTAIMGQRRLGMASSVMMSVRMAGTTAGALLMGKLAESAGYPVMFQCIAGFVLLGFLMLGVALKRAKNAAAPSVS